MMYKNPKVDILVSHYLKHQSVKYYDETILNQSYLIFFCLEITVIVSSTSVPVGLVAKKNQIQVAYNNPDHLKLYFKFDNTYTIVSESGPSVGDSSGNSAGLTEQRLLPLVMTVFIQISGVDLVSTWYFKEASNFINNNLPNKLVL